MPGMLAQAAGQRKRTCAQLLPESNVQI